MINNKTVSDLKEVNNPSQQIDVLLIQPKSNEDSIESRNISESFEI